MSSSLLNAQNLQYAVSASVLQVRSMKVSASTLRGCMPPFCCIISATKLVSISKDLDM